MPAPTPDVALPPAQTSTTASASPPIATCGIDFDPAAIPKRAWFVDGRFALKYCTLTVSPGGIGKSMFAIHEHVALACGRDDITGQKQVAGTHASWYINTEDPIDELQRRFAAAFIAHGMQQAAAYEAWKRVFFSSGRQANFRIAYLKDGQVVIDEQVVKMMTDFIAKNSIKLVTIDPFVRCHAVDENSNAQIDAVVNAFAKIAETTECAIHLVHHDGKGKHNDRDIDSARGASSLVSAARIAHRLRILTDEEASKCGVKRSDAWKYVALIQAKSNMGPRTKLQWFEKRGCDLPNGDTVGVMFTDQRITELLNKLEEEEVAGGDEPRRGRGRPPGKIKKAGAFKATKREFQPY